MARATYEGRPVRLTPAESRYGYNPENDDPWAQAIYDFEQDVLLPGSNGLELISLPKARRMAGDIAAALGIPVPPVTFEDIDEDGITDVGYTPQGRVTDLHIILRAKAPYAAGLLHEMAHAAAYRSVGVWTGHGPEFLARLFPVYAKYLGRDLKTMLDSAQARGLQFDRAQALTFARKIGCPVNDPVGADHDYVTG
jgi:hypothetical protein